MKNASRIFSMRLGLISALAVFVNQGCSSTANGETIKEVIEDVDRSDGKGSSDTPLVRRVEHSSNLEEMVSLLPFESRGSMAVDFEALFSSDASQAVAQMLSGGDLEEALGRPLRLIARHSLEMDISQTMRSTLLAQTSNPRDGSFLISKIRFDLLEEIPGLVDLESAGSYKGHAIYVDPMSHLSVVLLPGRLLAIAKEHALHSVIDVYEGDQDGAASGLLGAYLGDLNSGHPMTVVYGMPAMYKEIRTAPTLKSGVALSLWLEISDYEVSGEAVFYMEQASEFASIYNEATEAYNQPPLTVVQEANGKEHGLIVPISGFALDKGQSETVASRHELKMLFHIMEASNNVSGITTGETQPWKNFLVSDYPPSIFINWEIPESQVEAFSNAVLPRGFEMMKLRILETDEPAYYLVLNAYTATGMVAGVRQEWSLFVRDPVDAKPRFLVIEALSKSFSMDPVNMFTWGQPVTHVHEDGQLVTQAYKRKLFGKKHYFTSRINWPQNNPTTAKSAREFVSANDYIFWGNGVADRGLYAGVVYNRDVVTIPPGEYEIVNEAPWSQYINPQPKSVYVYQNELDILVAMWGNLDAPYLDVTDARRERLTKTRNNLTTNLMKTDVANAFKGKDHAILGVEMENAIPSVFYSYRIDESKVAAFESSLGLPDGFHLTRTRILESEREDGFYLTLGVFEAKDAVEGTRAEWWVYVDDGSSHAHVMVIDLMTEDAAFEPVALLNLPSVVEHGTVDGMLNTTLSSALVEFSASIPLDGGVEVMHTTDWVETREFVCYLNGICDKFYVDGGTLREPMVSFDPESISLLGSTPWCDYVEPVPASVLVRANRQILGMKPWYNVTPE